MQHVEDVDQVCMRGFVVVALFNRFKIPYFCFVVVFLDFVVNSDVVVG